MFLSMRRVKGVDNFQHLDASQLGYLLLPQEVEQALGADIPTECVGLLSPLKRAHCTARMLKGFSMLKACSI